jgi:hypothetical protein
LCSGGQFAKLNAYQSRAPVAGNRNQHCKKIRRTIRNPNASQDHHLTGELTGDPEANKQGST